MTALGTHSIMKSVPGVTVPHFPPTAVRAVSPWRSALSDERCLPASVRGPVECSELARLMAARSTYWSSTVAVAGMIDYLATGIARGRGAGGGRDLEVVDSEAAKVRGDW